MSRSIYRDQSGARLRDAFASADERAKQFVGVLAQSVRDAFVDSVPQWAAAVAWYAVLSALPLILVGGWIASFFVEPAWAADQLANLLDDFIPQGDAELEEKVQQAFAARNQVGLIALGGLLVTGTRVFDTLIRAMNIAFDTGSSYGFFKRLAIQAAMLLTIGGLFLVALMSSFLTRLAWEAVQFLPSQEGLVYALITWLFRATLLFVSFYLLYRYVPRGNGHAKAAAIGAATSVVLFLTANPIFQYFVQRFGNFNAIYGSLAILAIIMVWVYIASLITLFGAEVASHTEDMIFDGQTAEEVGRRHNERSPEWLRLQAKKAAAPGAD
jgi:membrane protein